MPLQFEVTVPYADGTITVRADDFKSLHEAAARLHELDRDARFLRSKGAQEIAPDHHKDGSENDYYGFRNPRTGANVTFGQMKDKASVVPFFPKGQDGYWEPEAKNGQARDERPSTTAQPAEGTVTLPPKQAAAARAMLNAGVKGEAAAELLARYGVGRISDLSDKDADDIVASDLALPF